MKPPVVVLGATGQVGLFAISNLLELGRQVIAVTRTGPGEQAPTIEGLQCIAYSDLQDFLARYDDTLSGKPALLSCGPAKLASEVIQLRQPTIAGHWERVVIIGTTSTMTKKSSAEKSERDMIAEIESALAVVCEVCEAGRIPLTILSPTLIYGCGMDQNLSRVYAWVQRFGFVPLASKAHGLRQPLHVQDLAATIGNALEMEPALTLDTPVCGSEAIPYEQMIREVFPAAGRKPRIARLHRFLVPPVIAMARIFPGFRGLNSQMFSRQSRDLVFDDTQACEHLGHQSRAFHPQSEDFLLPRHVSCVHEALT